MVAIPILLLIIGVAFWYRRMHLMVNHPPDRYERFHEAEKKFAHVLVKATERAARGLLAALRRVWEWLGRRFSKREPPLLED
jgi:hypothetical protein